MDASCVAFCRNTASGRSGNEGAMSFASGKGGDLYVGGFAIHDLLRQFSYTNSADVHDVTTFKSDSRKFIGGLRNGVLSAEGIVDSGNEGQVRELLSAATGKVWTAFPAPSALGGRGGTTWSVFRCRSSLMSASNRSR